MTARFGLTLLVRDDANAIAEYRRAHAEAWPETVSALRRIGVTEMLIFLLGRRMFMYIEAVDGFDPGRDFERANDDPRYQEWVDWMATLQERAPEAAPGEWWAEMELVYDLNWPQYTGIR